MEEVKIAFISAPIATDDDNLKEVDTGTEK